MEPFAWPQVVGKQLAALLERHAKDEVVAVDDAFQKLIHDGASEAELERAARKMGPSLLDDGIAKVKEGLTTVDEVARVVRDEG